MDNIQLCYIDNEINKIDKMKQGDVIYKNGMELLVVLSYDHNEPVSSSPKVYCDYYIDDRNIGTPLTDKGYVDWNKMLVLLRQKNLL